MENQKVLPCPTPGDSTVTVPLADSTICYTIFKPRPMPSLFNLAVRYSLPN